uniref:Uncharacterized protein n=1 Tax=Anguilla anguilla TaxID=7936 RepID=A0A0E9SCR3_ANGAN
MSPKDALWDMGYLWFRKPLPVKNSQCSVYGL